MSANTWTLTVAALLGKQSLPPLAIPGRLVQPLAEGEIADEARQRDLQARIRHEAQRTGAGASGFESAGAHESCV